MVAHTTTANRPTVGTDVTVTFVGSDAYDADTITGHVIDLDADSILIGHGDGELSTVFDIDQTTGRATVTVR